MTKTILITGATDGIGKLTAQTLAKAGHRLLVHGRSAKKLEALLPSLGANAQSYIADLSSYTQTCAMAEKIQAEHPTLDVLINNAGVFKVPNAVTAQGLDLRFVVNTFAPYVLTRALRSRLAAQGRVVNLSSAAQALVDEDALLGRRPLQDMEAYAQSKLGITIWSSQMAKELSPGQVMLAVNPGSLLASKMVKQGFGVPGKDLSVGANILCKAATDPEFADANGKYFDNDLGRFGDPNPGVYDDGQVQTLMRGMTGALEIWKQDASSAS